jgi:hypothetical protein
MAAGTRAGDRARLASNPAIACDRLQRLHAFDIDRIPAIRGHRTKIAHDRSSVR